MYSYLNCLLPLEKQFWKAIRTWWFRKSSMEFSEGVIRIFACPSSHKYLFNDKIDQHNLWNCFTLLTKISSITPKKFEISFQWKLCGNFLTATHLAFLRLFSAAGRIVSCTEFYLFVSPGYFEVAEELSLCEKFCFDPSAN